MQRTATLFTLWVQDTLCAPLSYFTVGIHTLRPQHYHKQDQYEEKGRIKFHYQSVVDMQYKKNSTLTESLSVMQC